MKNALLVASVAVLGAVVTVVPVRAAEPLSPLQMDRVTAGGGWGDHYSQYPTTGVPQAVAVAFGTHVYTDAGAIGSVGVYSVSFSSSHP